VDLFEFGQYKVTCYNKWVCFVEYVNMFLKLKQESSGYPSYVRSEEGNGKYIKEYWHVEGIALDNAYNSKNAKNFGKTKIKINMGKWAQNQNNTQTTLLSSVKELYELVTGPGTEVTKLIFSSDDVVWVS